VEDYLAASVSKDDVTQFESLRPSRVFRADNFAGPCRKEESGNQQINGVVEGAGLGRSWGPESM
jgi:hypothetical protein